MELQDDKLERKGSGTSSASQPILLKSSDSEAERDSMIWNAFRAGSREALDHIFKLYTTNLYSYGSRFTKDTDLVMDSIQDLFVELWNRRQSISETTSIKFYLFKSLRRRLIRALFGAKRLESVKEEAHYLEDKINFSVEHFLVIQETEQFKKAKLKKAIEGLTRRQRESIYLKFFQGLDNQAIASIMGLSESSVNTLVSQAISALRTNV